MRAAVADAVGLREHGLREGSAAALAHAAAAGDGAAFAALAARRAREGSGPTAGAAPSGLPQGADADAWYAHARTAGFAPALFNLAARAEARGNLTLAREFYRGLVDDAFAELR